MPTNDINEARLIVLGQIQVVSERMLAVENALIDKPLDDITPLTTDEHGNLSFQIGMLVGVIGNYQDLCAKLAKKNSGPQFKFNATDDFLSNG